MHSVTARGSGRAEYFEVRVEAEFTASHDRAPDGASSERHAHRWKVAARARSDRLDPIGLVVDFRRLRQMLEDAVAELDGAHLESHPDLDDRGTTAASVAAWILRRLSRLTEGSGYDVVAVEVECDPGMTFEARR